MFFTIAPQVDHRFPNHDKLANYWFSHDDGWQFYNNSWVKGYNHPDIGHGNFIKINIIADNHISLEHDQFRGFPLWWNSDRRELTNLIENGQQIYADQLVSLYNGNLHLSAAVDYTCELSYDLNIDAAADLVCENLLRKIKALKDWNPDVPKKMFLTGGVDTILLYSLLKYSNLEVDIVDYEYLKYDDFLNKNLSVIKKTYWAYDQIHHWTTPTLLISGSNGDEILFRSPETIALWASWHNIKVSDQLENWRNCYHYDYFNRRENVVVFQQYWENRSLLKQQYPSSKDIATQIVNLNYNDFQHWHLGNTLTWTPFKDIELLKIMLRLDVDSALTQAFDASINKKIIKKLYPAALGMLNDFKNLNSRQNLKIYGL